MSSNGSIEASSPAPLIAALKTIALAPAAMAATGPKTVRVDCAKGESINEAAFFNFSDGMLFNDSTLDGSLNCFNGGNALCQDPADVTGSSSCTLCPKP